MRQTLRMSLVAAAAVLLSAAPAAAQGKVGYVNTQAVLAQTPAMATAQQEFNQRVAPYNAEAQKMDSSFKALVAAATRETGPARDARAKEIQDRQASYEKRLTAIEDTVQSYRQRLIVPIMQHLEKSLEEVRKEGGYAIIFDVAGGAPIVSADSSLDVTQAVIAKMKSMPTAANAPRNNSGPVARPAGVQSRPPASPER
ncbi:MAG TPA: OmpH family outer membrane protein [Gemmatimonadaceae bacterium]|nr:OmpH family outer membrane protein [Gemmatimonadaceae bacterium]